MISDLALILFLTVIAPLIIVLHFVTRWKQSREISSDDEKLLEELWGLSQRMEDRIDTLERILDDDRPTWREK
ncbi:MAG: envelope stress response membrane protein PspB [Pseudomonadota bacterium]